MRLPRMRRYALPIGLTVFLYQRDGEVIAFGPPDPAASGTGRSFVARVVDIRWLSAV